MTIQVDEIRKQFPFFKGNNKLIYFDNAATTHKPKSVIDSYVNFYSNYNSNVHRGVYELAEKATEEFESTRDYVANFISAKSKETVIFTRGTTESINLVAKGWGKHNLCSGDHILLTEMEHHSNLVPWQMIAEEMDLAIDFIPIENTGKLNLDNLDSLISEKTKFVSIAHQSNVLGTINPIKTIIDKAHKYGAAVLIDGAQSVAHQKINVQELDCDFFVFSGHKIYGPTGVGVLYGKKNMLQKMKPLYGGGEMIDKVTKVEFTLNDIPWRFEAGTPAIAEVISLKEAIKFIRDLGIDNVHQYETKLINYAQERLLKLDNLKLYSPIHDKGPTLTFNIDKIHSYDFTKVLDQLGVAIRSGHHCAQPLLDKFNISSSNRASLAVYNSVDEVDRFIDLIKKCLKILL